MYLLFFFLVMPCGFYHQDVTSILSPGIYKSFLPHPEVNKQTVFWGTFPCLCLRMEKRDITKNHRTRKTWACKTNFLTGWKKTQPNLTFPKAEIISSHTATITNTVAFPKGLKDLKKPSISPSILYSGCTRKNRVMWMEASKCASSTLLSVRNICPEFLSQLFQDAI